MISNKSQNLTLDSFLSNQLTNSDKVIIHVIFACCNSYSTSSCISSAFSMREDNMLHSRAASSWTTSAVMTFVAPPAGLDALLKIAWPLGMASLPAFWLSAL